MESYWPGFGVSLRPHGRMLRPPGCSAGRLHGPRGAYAEVTGLVYGVFASVLSTTPAVHLVRRGAVLLSDASTRFVKRSAMFPETQSPIWTRRGCTDESADEISQSVTQSKQQQSSSHT